MFLGLAGLGGRTSRIEGLGLQGYDIGSGVLNYLLFPEAKPGNEGIRIGLGFMGCVGFSV